MSGASFASAASGTCDSRGHGGVRGAANAAGNMAPPEVPPTPRRIRSAAGRKVVGPSACRGGAGQAQKRAPGTRVRCHSGAAGRREAGVSRTAAARSGQECLVKGQVFSRSASGTLSDGHTWYTDKGVCRRVTGSREGSAAQMQAPSAGG